MGSKSGLYFCCRDHKNQSQKVGGIKAIMPLHYGTGTPENTYRRIAFASKEKICERCGFDKHEAAIIVHHIDRDRNNNNINNLEVLCANCHAIEHWGDN
jgi:5-methylcytosine-specific restriction endonuclease McrA